MIRLTIAPEPKSFRKKVREPGENALALLAGKPLPHKRRGRPIQLMKKVGGQMVKKTIDDFPCWQDCLDELYEAYGGICAYYCFFVEKATLPQVDHFVAKKAGPPPPTDTVVAKQVAAWDKAYDWSNYRLACGYANVCKNDHPDVLDPADIQDGWFQLDLRTLAVIPDPALPEPLRTRVDETIRRLKLDKERALAPRRRAMDRFRHGMALDFLHHDHPFLARELVRQGITSAAQLPPLPPDAVSKAIEPELIATS